MLREGAEVVLYDGNDKLDREEILSKIPESRNGSLQILLGTLADEKKAQLLKILDLVCCWSGVPTDLPIVNEMMGRESRCRKSNWHMEMREKEGSRY